MALLTVFCSCSGLVPSMVVAMNFMWRVYKCMQLKSLNVGSARCGFKNVIVSNIYFML